jgi:hypothetical protein
VKSKNNHPIATGCARVHPNRMRRILRSLLLGLAVATPVPAMAQAPAHSYGPGRLPEKHYMTKNAFFLPVNIDERARPGIKEIQLYVKEGPGGVWTLKEKAPPTQAGFNYRLTQDGEYWFNVVTIDLAGKATPPDVAKEMPGIIVVLDTQAPSVELKPLTECPEGICVQCEVRDANPNPSLTKFEYQTGDRVWRQLEPMPGRPESFCIPRQAVLSGLIKVTCTDRAQNTASREFNLATMGESGVVHAVGRQEPMAVTQASNHEKPESPPHQTHVPPPPPSAATCEGCKGSATQPNLPPGAGNEVAFVPAKGPALATCQDNTPPCDASKKPKAVAKWNMVNNPHISLEYRIEEEGKSGVGKLEVWVTKDEGRSWQILCDDPHRKSPVEFDLPGEGLYGFRLVACNGRGFGAEPPRPGDAPEYMVELDTTKPQAELLSVKIGPPEDHACVDIAWQAIDKNFGPEPIDLYYSVQSHGPWTPIAKGAPNTGKYRWYLPMEIGKQAYVRLVATDLAGNCTRCESTEAVALDDMSRPRARIVGITPGAQSSAPSGN